MEVRVGSEFKAKIYFLMSTDGGPPVRPPQMSPDGKWVWNGSEWQPVAGRDSGHQSVFPAFNQAALDSSLMGAEPAAAPSPPQVQAAAPPASPIMNYPIDYGAQPGYVPLWQRQVPRLNKNITYIVVGVVALIAVLVLLNTIGPISWPWSGGSPSQAQASPTPPGATTRSDYAVADRFIVGFLSPVIKGFNQTVAQQVLACNNILTIGCQGAVTETDNQVINVIAAVDPAPAPVCIAPAVTKIKGDLASIRDALKTSLQAYKDNSKTELASGLASFNYFDRALQQDILAAIKSQGLYCDTQQTGP